MAMIRDFIYLDIERVRSFHAQLAGGLPLEYTVESEEQVGAKGSVKAGLSGFGARGDADVRFHQSNTETFSLHDHIMAEFMEELRKKKFISDCNKNGFEWKASNFNDGDFMLASGIVKIIDHKLNVSMLERFPRMLQTINQFSENRGSNKSSKKKRDQNHMTSKQIKELASFVELNMQDLMRIKIHPIRNYPRYHFVATADPSFFRYKIPALLSLYGQSIDANWSCLLQVNKGVKHNVSSEPFSLTAETDSIEKILEYVADYYAVINEKLQGVVFPAVAATPIAIFREISKPV